MIQKSLLVWKTQLLLSGLDGLTFRLINRDTSRSCFGKTYSRLPNSLLHSLLLLGGQNHVKPTQPRRLPTYCIRQVTEARVLAGQTNEVITMQSPIPTRPGKTSIAWPTSTWTSMQKTHTRAQTGTPAEIYVRIHPNATSDSLTAQCQLKYQKVEKEKSNKIYMLINLVQFNKLSVLNVLWWQCLLLSQYVKLSCPTPLPVHWTYHMGVCSIVWIFLHVNTM